MDLMKHGKFLARVNYDKDLGMFHGRVINTRSVITFYGSSVEELEREFAASIDVFVDFCAEKGIEAEKPFSGEFRARVGPELHRDVSVAAALRGVSMNNFVTEALATAARDVVDSSSATSENGDP